VYTGSIHQLRRWSQELLGCELTIIHRVANMMTDVDTLIQHINIIIHIYLTQDSHMRGDDVVQRPFVYSYGCFNTCSNPCRITASDTSINTETSSLLPSLSIIYHYPINFKSTPITQSYSTLSFKSQTFHHIVPRQDILSLSFDTVTTSFGSLLSLWPGDSMTNFSFETDPKYYQFLFCPHLLHLHIQHFPIYYIIYIFLKL